MKLTRVRLENVRTVTDGEYAFAHPDGRPFDIALVTGPAASGKSTMLEAIAMAKQRVAPAGRPARPREFLRTGESNGRVELTLLLTDEERARTGITEPVVRLRVMLSGGMLENDPKLVRLLEHTDRFDYFPANRTLTEPLGMEPAPDEATERRIRLSADPDKYRGVVSWLRGGLAEHASNIAAQLARGGMVMGTDVPDPLAGFRARLAAMCPWLRLEGLGPDGATPMFLREGGSNPPMFELSAAERDAVLLAATLERTDHRGGIVLIDRADLHAHPDDQLRWLTTLQADHGCQVVVTATSERLSREIPGAQHVVLERRA
jgi:hypothetical protein